MIQVNVNVGRFAYYCFYGIIDVYLPHFYRLGDRGNADGSAEDNAENDDDEAVDMEDFEESGMLHMIDPVRNINLKFP